tara:strand:+ start:463 stop:741 length:279 start_codon:yes stop_codon:yes gene_type:complete
MIAIYGRYFETIKEEYESLTDAIRMLQQSEEACQIFSIGVYDADTDTAHVSVCDTEDKQEINDQCERLAKHLGFPDIYRFSNTTPFETFPEL